ANLGTAPTLRTIEYGQAQTHLLSYNLTLERQFPGNMLLSLRYAASRGLNLIQTVEGDPIIPQLLSDGTSEFWPGTAGHENPAWNYCECKTSGGDSWYNSLQVNLERKLYKNLQYQLSYTYSKLLDTTQGLHGGEAGGSDVQGTDPVHVKTDK